MKIKYLLIFVFAFSSCINRSERPNFYSFQNKWGVICFFDPIHSIDRQRMVFLPLEDPADSNSISDRSSIFDFKYGTGMDFDYCGKGEFNLKVYRISNHEKILTDQGDTAARIRWAFVKIKYHKVAGKNASGKLFNFTLFNKIGQLEVQSCDFDRSIVIDTGYFKKKYVEPFIDTSKSKLKTTKPRPGLYL